MSRQTASQQVAAAVEKRKCRVRFHLQTVGAPRVELGPHISQARRGQILLVRRGTLGHDVLDLGCCLLFVRSRRNGEVEPIARAGSDRAQRNRSDFAVGWDKAFAAGAFIKVAKSQFPRCDVGWDGKAIPP